MTEKLDRRVRRTRRALHGALLDLITTHDYDAITVTQIVDAADLRRATFYLHYDTKDDLLRAVLSKMLGEIEDTPGSMTDDGFHRAVFAHIADHVDVYRALVTSSGSALAQQIIHEALVERVRAAAVSADDADLPAEIVSGFVGGVQFALVMGCLRSDASLSPDAMAQTAQRLVTRGLG